MSPTNVPPRPDSAEPFAARNYAAEYARRQAIAEAAGFSSYWRLRQALAAGDPRASAALRKHPRRRRPAA